MQQKTTQLVKANPYFWGTAEAGTSDGCKIFIDVQAQYITSGLIMKKKILQTIAKTNLKYKCNKYHFSIEHITEPIFNGKY